MLLQENTFFDLDSKVKVICSVAQYPLHHVTYAPVKFEVAMSNSLGGGTFTRKYIIIPTLFYKACTVNFFFAPPPGALGRGQKVKYHLVSITKSI